MPAAVKFVIAFALFLSATAFAAPPNILFILADDLRADALGCYGNTKVQTPHLDQLAAQGTLFTSAYIQGSRNGAVCVPSRAMVMTGRNLMDFDESALTIPVEYEMFPQRLRAQGYDTFITGKWHNDRPSLNRAFSTGNSIFFGGMHDPASIPLHPYDPTGAYPDDRAITQQGQHATNLFADAAIDFLRDPARAQRPFMAYLPFTVPHDPRIAPADFHDKYKGVDMTLPDNFLPEHPFDNGEMQVRDELLAAHPRENSEIRSHLADYYAVISHMDQQIGRILEALRASGAADNTTVVFAADSGLAIGSHGLMGKQNIYEHSVRVPLIIAGPGLPKAARSDALLYLSDLAPTLLELCSLPADLGGGNSFAQVLMGNTAHHRDHLTFRYKDFQRGVRQGDWKYIRHTVSGNVHEQLFNLADDPHETQNLVASEEQAAVLDRLKSLLPE